MTASSLNGAGAEGPSQGGTHGTGPRGGERGSALGKVLEGVREIERLTRPGALPGAGTQMRRRWEQLPAGARTPAQMLGRLTPGCEGTHGVFPRCNFACSPCYHGREANRVRVDGLHTVVEVARQMQTLAELRGPAGHCQLIGGEVSLLRAEDHARALEIMRFYGRIPMSFTHGDFDLDYLRRLSLRKDGKPRFRRVDFAVHFDRFMVGRRGAERVDSERALMPYRRRFMGMFKRMKREHGVNYYVAHNMTVQPGNLEEVAEVVRLSKNLGFRMMSFQPAAFMGDERRWKGAYEKIAQDDGEGVWERIEKGVGCRLPYSLFQVGDFRCNRMCLGAFVGSVADPDCPFIPFFDDRSIRDTELRDEIMAHVGNIVLPTRLLALKIFRAFVTHPRLFVLALMWCVRFAQRAGGIHRILRYGVRMMTFVMHRFMDSKNVAAAWDLLEAGVEFDDPRVAQAGPKIRETMERLSACSYGMAQTEERRLVPACVQHSVYDEKENRILVEKLKLRDSYVSSASADAPLSELHKCGTS